MYISTYEWNIWNFPTGTDKGLFYNLPLSRLYFHSPFTIEWSRWKKSRTCLFYGPVDHVRFDKLIHNPAEGEGSVRRLDLCHPSSHCSTNQGWFPSSGSKESDSSVWDPGHVQTLWALHPNSGCQAQSLPSLPWVWDALLRCQAGTGSLRSCRSSMLKMVELEF